MIVALFPNEKKPQSFEIAKQIAQFFRSKKVTVVSEEQKSSKIGVQPLSSVPSEEIDFLISMGGDGTILGLCHRYAYLNAPILGINLGHLGFMADIPMSDIFESLEDLMKGAYTIDERLILETPTLSAVNDIVIHRAQNCSLIELALHVNGTYLNTFLADGIIIATPNGSTAYSLAAGGPILSSALKAFVITPICPHTISNRPIVLTSDQIVQVQYLSPYDPVEVRADGISFIPLKTKESITIQQSQRTFKRVNLNRHEYFSTLRTKLGWSGKLIH